MKKFLSVLLVFALYFALMVPITALAQGEVIELATYDDLFKITGTTTDVRTTIDGNTVKDAIHFFEDNTNRRAYCSVL